jgi:hypothetical protein
MTAPQKNLAKVRRAMMTAGNGTDAMTMIQPQL